MPSEEVTSGRVKQVTALAEVGRAKDGAGQAASQWETSVGALESTEDSSLIS